MPKIVKIFCFALLILGLLSFAYPILAQARGPVSATDCPKGRVYCQYPGQCSSYIDINNDNYCDLSIPAAAKSSNVAATPAGSANSSNSTAATSTTISNIAKAPTNTASAPAPGAGSSSKYYFLPILAIFAIAYGASYLLSIRNIISTKVHRRLWNIVLLISAAIMLVLGLLLTLRLEYRLNIQLPFDMTFWHVEAGIIMGLISVFHIAWHWRYFTRLMKPATQTDK